MSHVGSVILITSVLMQRNIICDLLVGLNDMDGGQSIILTRIRNQCVFVCWHCYRRGGCSSRGSTGWAFMMFYYSSAACCPTAASHLFFSYTWTAEIHLSSASVPPQSNTYTHTLTYLYTTPWPETFIASMQPSYLSVINFSFYIHKPWEQKQSPLWKHECFLLFFFTVKGTLTCI